MHPPQPDLELSWLSALSCRYNSLYREVSLILGPPLQPQIREHGGKVVRFSGNALFWAPTTESEQQLPRMKVRRLSYFR